MTRCLFCGNAGATREHVLSQAWLTRLMPSTGPYHFDRTAEEQGVVTSRRYERRRPEIVRRAVCAACNNGWMNELDQAVQPMATAMVTGSPILVGDIVNKTRLAAWVCKVSVLVDSMQKVEGALAPSHAHYLHRELMPPPGWRVWLAALDRFEEHHATLAAVTLLRPHGRGYLGTIGVNHLVAQVMVLPNREPEGTHPMHEHVVQLWPPLAEPMSWPPPRRLRDTVELGEFGEIVAGASMSTQAPPPQVPLDLGDSTESRGSCHRRPAT